MTFRLAELEERIRRLDQERDAVNRILDAAVGALNFSPGAHGADPNGQASPEEEREGLLRETAQKVRALVPLRALAFYLLSEDGLDFRAALTDPVGAGKSFEAELEPLVEDGTLAWALNHPHPVFVTTADGSRPLLLHALSTPNRTLGVLLGEPSCDPQTLPDIALAFLRVVLNAAARFSQTLICNPGLGFKSVKDMLEAAKSRELTYATGGAGSPGHLVMESLLSSTGVKMVHVPYKGPAPAMQDLMGGQVNCGFLAAPTVLPQIQSGRVTALATSGRTRSPLLPTLPTIAESGYPDFDGTYWLLLAAPKGVPAEIQKRFLAAMDAAIRSPQQQERVKAVDIEMVGSSPEQAQARVREISDKWEALTRKINLKPD